MCCFVSPTVAGSRWLGGDFAFTAVRCSSLIVSQLVAYLHEVMKPCQPYKGSDWTYTLLVITLLCSYRQLSGPQFRSEMREEC